MIRLKVLNMLLFVGILNFSLVSCRETPEDPKDDDMEMEHGEMMDDDDTNENIDHQGHDH